MYVYDTYLIRFHNGVNGTNGNVSNWKNKFPPNCIHKFLLYDVYDVNI